MLTALLLAAAVAHATPYEQTKSEIDRYVEICRKAEDREHTQDIEDNGDPRIQQLKADAFTGRLLRELNAYTHDPETKQVIIAVCDIYSTGQVDGVMEIRDHFEVGPRKQVAQR